jgi:hypothetical protein
MTEPDWGTDLTTLPFSATWRSTPCRRRDRKALCAANSSVPDRGLLSYQPPRTVLKCDCPVRPRLPVDSAQNFILNRICNRLHKRRLDCAFVAWLPSGDFRPSSVWRGAWQAEAKLWLPAKTAFNEIRNVNEHRSGRNIPSWRTRTPFSRTISRVWNSAKQMDWPNCSNSVKNSR